MLEISDFAQDYWSRTATGIYKIVLKSIRILKWSCYNDRSFYEILNYYDLMGSVCKYLIEISQR